MDILNMDCVYSKCINQGSAALFLDFVVFVVLHCNDEVILEQIIWVYFVEQELEITFVHFYPSDI